MQSAVNNGTSTQMAQNKVKCRLPNNKPPKEGPKLYRKPKTNPTALATNEKGLRARKPNHIATQHKATASSTLLTQPTLWRNIQDDAPLTLPNWTAENTETRNSRNANESKGTRICRYSAH